MEDLGKRLKEIRKEKGITQREASEKLGLTRNAYTNYEMGIREPSLDTFKKICQMFEVTSDYLLGL